MRDALGSTTPMIVSNALRDTTLESQQDSTAILVPNWSAD